MTTESSKLGSIRPDHRVSQNPSRVAHAWVSYGVLFPRLLGSQRSCGCSKLLLGDFLLGGFWLYDPASELCIPNIYPAAAEPLEEQVTAIQKGFGRTKMRGYVPL